MLVSWNWLQDYLGKEVSVTATEAAEKLGMHAFELEGIEEKENDTIIDVDILPNRSSDCLCQRGIARELATLLDIPLAYDPLAEPIELATTDAISVAIEDAHACPRFTAALITGIEVKESPQWLKDRLTALGQRPINNIVDATNYVMYAIGQPLHAYDAELFPQVDGKWQFAVRYAKEGESVSLIPEGEKTEDRIIECIGTELLIVDASSQTPIGLAGVKGGRFAGVHDGTTQVIIEAAHFHPTVTRKTARRLGIVIDASKRFENEPSRELPLYAQRDIIKLITDIAGGTFEGHVDEYLEKQSATEVAVTVAKTNSLLGLSLTSEEIKRILVRTGSTVVEAGDGVFAVIGPWERTDLRIEEDFIEEVGRIYGYTAVKAISPKTEAVPELNKRHYYSEKIRQVLMAEGFSEVITSSFRNKDQVQLRNALASDKSYLRSSLNKNLSEALDKNAGFTDLLGTQDTRLFEIGAVFYKDGQTLAEHVALAFGVRVKASGYSGKEDKVLQEVVSTLEVALGTTLEFENDKGVAELNLTNLLQKLDDPVAYDAVEVAEEIVYQPFSVYQHMSRDIAMWVSEGTTAAEVEAVLNAHTGDLRVRTTLFDEFTKDGNTSYAFRLVFQSKEKTLTDSEVNKVMDSVYAAVAERGWEVR